MLLSDVCLTVVHIWPKSRAERPRKTKIDTVVAHVTRDLDTTFKVKGQKVKVTRPLYSLPCWRFRQLQRWAWERVGREKLLLRCRLLGRTRCFGAHEERRGVGTYRVGRPPTACYELLYIYLTDQFTDWTILLPAVHGHIFVHAVVHNGHTSVL